MISGPVAGISGRYCVQQTYLTGYKENTFPVVTSRHWSSFLRLDLTNPWATWSVGVDFTLGRVWTRDLPRSFSDWVILWSHDLHMWGTASSRSTCKMEKEFESCPFHALPSVLLLLVRYHFTKLTTLQVKGMGKKESRTINSVSKYFYVCHSCRRLAFKCFFPCMAISKGWQK